MFLAVLMNSFSRIFGTEAWTRQSFVPGFSWLLVFCRYLPKNLAFWRTRICSNYASVPNPLLPDLQIDCLLLFLWTNLSKKSHPVPKALQLMPPPSSARIPPHSCSSPDFFCPLLHPASLSKYRTPGSAGCASCGLPFTRFGTEASISETLVHEHPWNFLNFEF